MRMLSCHDTYRGHVCGGNLGECVRRGYHMCRGTGAISEADELPARGCTLRWPYLPPVERWQIEQANHLWGRAWGRR